jgi:enediyne polyketide synthase
VTGGGKGITAECALALAERTGVKLALWGRSQPQADDELATNLNRFTEAGVTFHYHAVDVTDAAAVQAAVQATEAALGPITALLHGAARNAPQSLRTLSEVDFQRTLAPKVTGLRHLLAALDPAKLRLIVGFGSIIARLGLPGEADYAVANDWMAAMLQRHQAAHPHCHTLTIHWSVWAGAGMGERLGTLDGLMRQGITPIPLDQGVAMLQQLLAQVDQLPPTVVVAGRYGTPTTLRVEQPELPFRRFLEQVRVHVPGVELVVDATLSGENDPYMDDHVFRGDRLFLAVLGLEAMAQVAMALTGATVPPSFEQVQFHRPIVVPPGSEVTVRLAALRRENGDIAVVLRSAETGFQADHFQAICRFDEPALAGNRQKALGTFSLLQLDPAQELYEQLFFHKGRFRRVQGYRQVAAQTMVAELSPNDGQTWFGRYLPQELVLGDPGARDATIHAIQVCVPLGTLLPMGVERIAITAAAPTGPRFVHAVERRSAATADTLIFDVTVVDAAGNAVEEWQGLKLKRMDGTAYAGPWSPPVLAPYLERRMQELLPQAPSIALVREPAAKQADRRKRSTEAMQRAIGKPLTIHRRADGQPSTRGKWNVSAAHAGDLTLAVAAPQAHGTVGCDLEAVQTRSRESWQDLLGKERLPLADLVAGESGDAFDVAATRVWGALEALKKAGVALETPLMLDAATPDRWVTFTAGVHRVATYVAQVQGVAESMVATVAMGK